MKNLYKRYRRWLDWKAYWLFFSAANRIFMDSPGMAYLLELRLRDYRGRYPLPDSLKRSTEAFFESQQPGITYIIKLFPCAVCGKPEQCYHPEHPCKKCGLTLTEPRGGK